LRSQATVSAIIQACQSSLDKQPWYSFPETITTAKILGCLTRLAGLANWVAALPHYEGEAEFMHHLARLDLKKEA